MKHIVSKLNVPCVNISTFNLIEEPFFIFTYTDGLGDVPKIVSDFLTSNHSFCKGVIASGNINFQDNYCRAANIISSTYNIPIIRKIDLRGTQQDVIAIQNAYREMKGDESIE